MRPCAETMLGSWDSLSLPESSHGARSGLVPVNWGGLSECGVFQSDGVTRAVFLGEEAYGSWALQTGRSRWWLELGGGRFWAWGDSSSGLEPGFGDFWRSHGESRHSSSPKGSVRVITSVWGCVWHNMGAPCCRTNKALQGEGSGPCMSLSDWTWLAVLTQPFPWSQTLDAIYTGARDFRQEAAPLWAPGLGHILGLFGLRVSHIPS